MSNKFMFGAMSTSSVFTEGINDNPTDLTKEAVTRLQLNSPWKQYQWKGNTPFHCPYHKDNTPSMYIHMEKGLYNCFSCQRHGHISGLYKDLLGRDLYKDLNISMDEFSKFTHFKARSREPEDYSKLSKEVDIKMSGNVAAAKDHIETVRYLRKRGIPFEVAEQMQMMYMEAGEINGIYFNNRLLMPVYEKHQLISVEGRALNPNDNKKVLYPKNSTVDTLYELDMLDDSKPLFVVEGLMDLAVLRTDEYFQNSTAIFGALITHRQAWLLNQFPELIFIPDNDKAGRSTVRKLLETREQPFQVLEVPKLQYKDSNGEMKFIKDVGDITSKLHSSVTSLRKRGWGRTLRSSEDMRQVVLKWDEEDEY